MSGTTGPGITLYCAPGTRSLAKCWQDRFPIVETAHPPRGDNDYYLWFEDDHLALCRADEGAPGSWVQLDELQRRSAQGGDLARACGVSGGRRPRILDPMAGWGVDGLVLARRGCEVTLVEREPALQALQEDLIRRSGLDRVASRCADGFAVLSAASAFPVVYLDPMFPARNKSALPGKRMQRLAELARPDPRPLDVWLALAIARALDRVVLKRRRKDPAVSVPNWQIVGRTVRYDVYRGTAAE